MLYVSDFLILCWFCFWCALFCCCFVVVLFLFAFRQWRHCFPSNPSVFFELCWLKGSLFSCFMCVCVLVFVVSCVVCFQPKQWGCIALCLCCLLSFFATRLGGFLVWILWSYLLFVVLFWFLLFHSSLSKKAKTDTAKAKNKRKTPNFCSVSAVVFTKSVPNLWGRA